MIGTALTVSKVSGSVAKTIGKHFGKAVIERWSRHRAERFFEAFAEEAERETESTCRPSEADAMLTQILNDEGKSEVMFDAYRRVCLARSKRIGPRIIGLLTAELVLQGKMADATEEALFEVAETFSDRDFMEFRKVYSEYLSVAKTKPDVYVRMEEECLAVLCTENLSDDKNLDRQEVESGFCIERYKGDGRLKRGG
jgi:hypothetical protein